MIGLGRIGVPDHFNDNVSTFHLLYEDFYPTVIQFDGLSKLSLMITLIVVELLSYPQ